MEDLISVIIPVYNVERFLIRCYESIAKQTYSNLEIIFVDDGSPDRSGEICDQISKIDSRVKVIHKENEGLGFARNSGLDVATGRYVVFVDSDDFISEKYIEVMYTGIKETGADTCSCGIVNYYGPKRQYIKRLCNERTIYVDRSVKSDFLLSMIGSTTDMGANNTTPMSVWHQMYSMDIINEYRIRFHSEREFLSEDIIFQIDYFSRSKMVVKIPETLYYYYCDQTESLSTKYRKNRYMEEVVLSKELFNKLSDILLLKEYDLRLKGMFLGRVRTCLMVEYVHGNKKNFDQIINDPYLEEIINQYPIKRCKIDLRVFNYCLKKKWVSLIKLLLKLRKMRG